MLKVVSNFVNAIGALNYKGTWNASTNSPALASGVGTKGDYYVVSVAGSTSLDGISNWGIGDWAVFNGTAWQRVEGGADLNGVNLSVSGTTTLSGLTASTALALDASKNVVSVTNTGTGNNVLATSPTVATPTLTGNVSMTTGNLIPGTAGKGIDFSANANAAGMTSELLNWYEEGTFNAQVTDGSNNATMGSFTCRYTRIGRQIFVHGNVSTTSVSGLSGVIFISGLPFAISNFSAGSIGYAAGFNITAGNAVTIGGNNGESRVYPQVWDVATGTTQMTVGEWSDDGNIILAFTYTT